MKSAKLIGKKKKFILRSTGIKRDGILICGAYGAGNVGDEAILQTVIAQVRQVRQDARICVVTRRPDETAAKYGVDAVHTFNYPAILRAMRTSQLYINGGGTLIQDITSHRSLWYYLDTIRQAKKRGCKVIMYGCGIGPISGKADRRLVARIVDRYADIITLRDPASLAELERLGVTKPDIRLSADPVLTMTVPDREHTDEVCRRAGFKDAVSYVGVSVRRWSGREGTVEAVAGTLRTLYEERGLVPAFLSVINPDDESEMKAVAARLGDIPHLFVSGEMEARDMIALISRTELVISMRLHGLIFAVCAARAAVGIEYDPKVSAFAQYSGLGECVELEGLSAEELTDACERVIGADNAKSAHMALMDKNDVNLAALRQLIG